MRRLAILCLIGASAVTAGCTKDKGAAYAGGAATPPATATLTSPTGTVMGDATLTQTPNGIRLVVNGMGLPPGAHGVHIHTVGRCESPDFTSAGPHWNPTSARHGKDAPGGPHYGDAPNLIAGADGKGKVEVTLPGSITGGAMPLLDADGATVIIHATADDYRTDPSGNSGGRIACGAVTAG